MFTWDDGLVRGWRLGNDPVLLPVRRSVGSVLIVLNLWQVGALTRGGWVNEDLGRGWVLVVFLALVVIPALVMCWTARKVRIRGFAYLLGWWMAGAAIIPLTHFAVARWGSTEDCPGCDDWLGILFASPVAVAFLGLLGWVWASPSERSRRLMIDQR